MVLVLVSFLSVLAALFFASQKKHQRENSREYQPEIFLVTSQIPHHNAAKDSNVIH
jgi:hypothetical protein